MIEAEKYIRQEDFDQLEVALQDYLDEKIDHNQLVGERLMLGVYGQWQENLCMVRSKLPGGDLPLSYLLGYAEVLDAIDCMETVHITTRQDIQYNDVPLDQTPKLLRMLAKHGITTREACGNTVRNVSGCPMAGACQREHVDVMPYIESTAAYLVRNPLTQSLPRKFKITYSGCEADCAQGAIQDLGFVATRNAAGEPGFKVLAGGGLGPQSRQAIVIEEFLPEGLLLPVSQAILAMHDKYSDRDRRTRSRLKFLVDRFGAESFGEKFRTEFERTRSAFDISNAPTGKWRTNLEPNVNWEGQNPACLKEPTPMAWHDSSLVVPVNLLGGALNAEQLQGLAQLLDDGDAARLRTTQAQNLVLLGVPEARRETCLEKLAALSLSLPGSGDDVVNCPGIETCPLGITTSRRMARSLAGTAPGLRLGVNGCHNGCAGAEVSDIGLIGKARRHHGQMVPSYALRLGGGDELGIAGPDIPAVRTPAAIRQVREAWLNHRHDGESFPAWSRRKGGNYFHTLLESLTAVSKNEIPFLSRDQGDSTLFRVTAAGMGECAGSQASPAAQLLLSAAYESTLAQAFLAKQKYVEASECLRNRMQLTGRALLLAAGGKDGTPETLSTDLAKSLAPEDSHLAAGFAELEQALDSFSADPDEILFPGLLRQTDEWVESARSRCRVLQTLDHQSDIASRASM